MKYIIVRREETVLDSDTHTKPPKIDLKQDVKGFDKYDEARAYFKEAITLTPKYEREVDKNPQLNAAYQLIKIIQGNKEYTPNDEDVIPCEIGVPDGEGEYCLVTSDLIKLTEAGCWKSRYLATNVHNLSDSKDGFYFFREVSDKIFSGEIESKTFSITLTPLE